MKISKILFVEFCEKKLYVNCLLFFLTLKKFLKKSEIVLILCLILDCFKFDLFLIERDEKLVFKEVSFFLYWLNNPNKELNSLKKKNNLRKCSLNLKNNLQNCFFVDFKKFREIFIPQTPQIQPNLKKFQVKLLPFWMNFFFKNFREFNYIQTRILPLSLGTDLNLLVCAPTASGKTTIAFFCILRTVSNSINFKPRQTTILENFVKILYIAPMKALVKEIGKNFKIFSDILGLKIIEATGDEEISKNDVEVANIIIGTPEKIDILSRKENFKVFFSKIKLLIVDEIHLLNENRGSVLEEILIRFFTGSSKGRESIRTIGLSATLPNYHDIGAFLQVNPLKGLFYFSSDFNQVPLDKTIIGIKRSLLFKNTIALMNEIVILKIKQLIKEDPFVKLIIFVHSRRDTIKTGLFICDKIKSTEPFKNEQTSSEKKFFKKKIKSTEIKNLIEKNIGIHHAGLLKNDRILMENLFKNGHINILISTATLAWGVNLPATHIIVKGTKIYSPEKSSWVEISDFNLIQMIGRGGRLPGSRNSEGIIITTASNVSHYIQLFRHQLPVESRLLHFLPDCLNYECSGKRIFDINSALNWFSKTYMWIRFRRSILGHRFNSASIKNGGLLRFLENIFVIQSLNELLGSKMVLIEMKMGFIISTFIGKIASEFLIKYQTIFILMSEISQNTTYSEILHLISLSVEFSSFQIRKGEEYELMRLENIVFFPSKEKILNRALKINVLLQAYIGKIRIKDLSLAADSIFIGKVSSRLSRALFEISINKKLANFSQVCYSLFKAIKKRIWPIKGSLTRFFSNSISSKGIRLLEKEKLDLNILQNLKLKNLEKILKSKKEALIVTKLKKYIPSIKATFFLQPITRNTLRIHFVINIDLIFKNIQGHNEIGIWMFLEDQICDTLVFFYYLKVKKKKIGKNVQISTQVPFFDNPPSPYYRLRIVPDKISGADLEFSINLTSVFFPVNHSIVTKISEFRCSSPSRVLAGFKGGLVLMEYFLSHFYKMDAWFYQLIPYIFKKTDYKILSASKIRDRVLFMEFSILSYFLSCEFLVGFFLSTGNDCIKLKIAQIRKSSICTIGLPVSKFSREKCQGGFKYCHNRSLLVLSPNELFLSKKKKSQFFDLNLVFFSDSFHLLGDWNFGNSIEWVIERIVLQKKVNVRVFFTGTLFPVINLRDLLEWLQVKTSEAFYMEKINESRKKKTTQDKFIKSDTLGRSFIPLKKKTDKKFYPVYRAKDSLFFNRNFSDLKYNITMYIFSFLDFSKLGFPLFKNPLESLFFKIWKRNKVQRLLFFLKIGFIDDFFDFKKRRFVENLFISKNFSTMFITTGYLSKISRETLEGKLGILLYKFKSIRQSKIFFLNSIQFNERCKILKGFSFRDLLSSLKNLTIESLGDVWYVEKLLNFSIKDRQNSLKNMSRSFLESFFFTRLTRNPNFYNASKKIIQSFSIERFIESILDILNKEGFLILHRQKKFSISKKSEILIENILDKGCISAIFSYGNSRPQISEILKKLLKKSKCCFQSNREVLFWLFDKKIFFNKRMYKKTKKNDFCWKQNYCQKETMNQKLKLLILALIDYFDFKKQLKPLVFLTELIQIISSEAFKKKPTLFKFLELNVLSTFLMGKLHNIYSKEKLIKFIFWKYNLSNPEIPKNITNKIFKSFENKSKLIIKMSLEEHEAIRKLTFKFYLQKTPPSYNFSKTFLQKNNFVGKEEISWWVIIGDKVTNKLFIQKKIKDFNEFIIDLGFRSEKRDRKIEIFLINENWAYLDKESFLEGNF